MRRFFIYLTIAILVSSCASPEETYAEPKTPIEALELAVSRAANKGNAGAILDVQGCGLSFRRAKGISNRKTKTPMPVDEQLRIASIGKLYTAAVIHKLAQQGALDLDQPATTYLNEGEIDGVPNGEATLRHMLNHTSGVPDYYDARSYLFTDWTQPITVERTLKVARRKKATNAPGESYSYSNTNYQILDLIAEKVSGQSLGKLIETQILEPLQLKDTRYNTEHPGGTIHGYGTELRKNADTWKYAENTGADSGITTTSADLSRYLQALFLTESEFSSVGNAMRANPVEMDVSRQFAGAGAEMIRGRTGTELWGHTGDTFGYLTFAYAIPKYDLTIIGHTNTSNKGVFVEMLQSTTKIIGEACVDN